MIVEGRECPVTPRAPQPCSLCSRPSYTHTGTRWAHACCIIEIERWGQRDCVPCSAFVQRLLKPKGKR